MAKKSITVRHVIAVVVVLIIIILVSDMGGASKRAASSTPTPNDVVVLLSARQALDLPGMSITLRSILRLPHAPSFDVLLLASEGTAGMLSMLLEDVACFPEAKNIHSYVALDAKSGVLAQRVFEYPNLQRWKRVLYVANGVLFDPQFVASSRSAPAGSPQVHKSKTMCTFPVPLQPVRTKAEIAMYGLDSVVPPSTETLAKAKEKLALLPGCDVELNDKRKPIPALSDRNAIPGMLEEEQVHRVGAEVGVGEGAYAAHILREWKSCTKFVLMDPWVHQENYNDWANKNNEKQEEFYQAVVKRDLFQGDKVDICRHFAHVCKDKYEDGYFDFIYIDARPDYMSVSEYLYDMWPKLKVGGIIAGHDFITALEEPHGQDWGLNRDGSRNEGSVKGAVLDFFTVVQRTVYETREKIAKPTHIWTSWMARK